MNKYCIARNRLMVIDVAGRQVVFMQYHTPRGWSRDSSNAYHYDYRTAVRIALKIPGAFVMQAKVLNSHIRRVG